MAAAGVHWDGRETTLRHCRAEGEQIVWQDLGNANEYRTDWAFLVAAANLRVVDVDNDTGALVIKNKFFMFLERHGLVRYPCLTRDWFRKAGDGFGGKRAGRADEIEFASWEPRPHITDTAYDLRVVSEGGPTYRIFRRELDDEEELAALTPAKKKSVSY